MTSETAVESTEEREAFETVPAFLKADHKPQPIKPDMPTYGDLVALIKRGKFAPGRDSEMVADLLLAE